MKPIAFIIIALMLGWLIHLNSLVHHDGEYSKDQVKAHSRLIDREDVEQIEERKVALLRQLYGNEDE